MMSDALCRLHVAKVGDFEVSTVLFEGYMETRVFNCIEGISSIPEIISTNMREFAPVDFVGEFWEQDDAAIATDSFSGARDVHSAVVSIVKDFTENYTRKVMYVRK